MTTFLFANNANTTLSAPISAGAVSLTVQSGGGAAFPNPSAGQQFEVTMTDAATGLLTEIIYAGARSGDTFSSLLRAQEGTTARSWLAGDLVATLWTAGQAAGMQQTTGLFPARIVTASGVFAMSSSDANGSVGLNRTTSVATSSTTLPNSPGQYWIEDIAGNFHDFPVTVTYPGGTTGPNGATSNVLNIDGQCAAFRFYSSNNVWSFKP